jgi:hypothetical protein
MRDENALHFTNNVGHSFGRSVPPSATSLSVVTAMCTNLGIEDQFCKVPSSGSMVGIRGPAHEQGSTVLIRENLKNSSHAPRLRDAHKKTAEEKLNLLHGHTSSTAPVCPAGLVEFVIVLWSEIDDGMDETKDKTVGGVVEDHVDGHVIGVDCDFFSVDPSWRRALIAKVTADLG